MPHIGTIFAKPESRARAHENSRHGNFNVAFCLPSLLASTRTGSFFMYFYVEHLSLAPCQQLKQAGRRPHLIKFTISAKVVELNARPREYQQMAGLMTFDQTR
jgi:hypothetical protein